MKQRKQLLPRLLLLAAPAVGGLFGCSESPQTESPDHAVALARESLTADPPDFQTAHDFVVAAMRIAPTSPEVFDVATEFVTRVQNAASEDDAALAFDAYARIEALIAYQPVETIVSARKQFNQLGEAFEANSGVDALPQREAADSTDVVSAKLELAKSAECTPELRLRVLQQIRDELDSAMVDAVLLDPQASEDISERWRQATSQCADVETMVLSQLYEGLSERIDKFLSSSQESLDECNDTKRQKATGYFEEVGKKLEKQQTVGQRLLGEMPPYTDAGAGTSVEDAKKLEARLDLIARTRQWMHNQHALRLIIHINDINEKNLPAQERLKRLAQCEERMFTPYVLGRYQAEWERWFEELSTEDERIEAAKLRLIHEQAR